MYRAKGCVRAEVMWSRQYKHQRDLLDINMTIIQGQLCANKTSQRWFIALESVFFQPKIACTPLFLFRFGIRPLRTPAVFILTIFVKIALTILPSLWNCWLSLQWDPSSRVKGNFIVDASYFVPLLLTLQDIWPVLSGCKHTHVHCVQRLSRYSGTG